MQKYHLYCIDEQRLVECWSVTPPITCPDDPNHSINPGSICVDDPKILMMSCLNKTTDTMEQISLFPCFGLHHDFLISVLCNRNISDGVIEVVNDTASELIATAPVQSDLPVCVDLISGKIPDGNNISIRCSNTVVYSIVLRES